MRAVVRVLWLIACGWPAGAHAADPDTADTAAAPAQVAEIIVTAEKRPEDAQSAPLSVTAVSGERLAAMGMRDADHLNSNIPNFTISNGYGEDPPTFILRGVSNSDYSLNQQSPIALYVDDVYKSVAAIQSVQLFDIDRMEVLRGPQTTLYGKNATGGAVSFVTRAPSFGPSNGYLTLGYGSYDAQTASGAYGFQIVDNKLAARLAFTFDEADGYVRELEPGRANLNSHDTWGVRASLRFQPDPSLDMTLRLGASRAASDGYGMIPENIGPGGLSFITGYTRAGLSYFQTQSTDPAGVDGESRNASLTVVAALPQGLQLTSVSSFDWGKFGYVEDADGSPLSILYNGFFSGASVWAEDLRLATSNDSRFHALLGLYLSRESLTFNQFYDLDYSLAYLAPDGTPSCLLDGISGCNSDNDLRQVKLNRAVYADATYQVSDKLSVTAGLRESSDQGNMLIVLAGSGYYDPVLKQEFRDVFPPTTRGVTVSASGDHLDGHVAVDYKINADAFAYVSFSTGYRGAAFNGQAVSLATDNIAKPETLASWEVGAKTLWLHRRLKLNAAAFDYDYRNQQFLDINAQAQSILTNAPRASVYGFELEADAAVSRDLEVQGSIGWNHGRYDQLALYGQNLAGNRLIDMPSLTLGTIADWTFLRTRDVTLVAHADASYESRRYFDAFQLLRSSEPGYWLANARLTAQFDRHELELSAWVRNLADVHYEPFKLDFPFFNYVYAQRGAPRMFGVELTKTF